MNENVCNDNRFNLIAKYKAKLIEATNIETSQDEMAVIDCRARKRCWSTLAYTTKCHCGPLSWRWPGHNGTY